MSLETVVKENFVPQRGYCYSNSSPLEEQQILLTSDLSPASKACSFWFYISYMPRIDKLIAKVADLFIFSMTRWKKYDIESHGYGISLAIGKNKD